MLDQQTPMVTTFTLNFDPNSSSPSAVPRINNHCCASVRSRRFIRIWGAFRGHVYHVVAMEAADRTAQHVFVGTPMIRNNHLLCHPALPSHSQLRGLGFGPRLCQVHNSVRRISRFLKPSGGETLSAHPGGEEGPAKREGEVGGEHSEIPHLTPALSAPRGGEGVRPQLNRSGQPAHKDLDGSLPDFPPIAAAGFRSRSRRLPAESFRSSGKLRPPRRG